MLKIIRQTPTQLVLRHRPIALWALGSFLTVIGVVIIILFSKASSLTCERVPSNQGRCELVHSHFVLSKTIIISVNDLKGTEVVMTRARQLDSFFILRPYYRVMLITPTERIPLSLYGTSNRETPEAIAVKINDFLSHPHLSELTVKQDNRWFFYLVGSLLVMAGLVAELSRVITMTFDKVVGCLRIERQNLLGTEEVEYSLEEIVGVKLCCCCYYYSKTIFYQVVLELSSGDNLLLSANSSWDQTRKQKCVDEIADFLALASNYQS